MPAVLESDTNAGFGLAALAARACSAAGSENTPPECTSRPVAFVLGSVADSVASPAVETTVAASAVS